MLKRSILLTNISNKESYLIVHQQAVQDARLLSITYTLSPSNLQKSTSEEDIEFTANELKDQTLLSCAVYWKHGFVGYEINAIGVTINYYQEIMENIRFNLDPAYVEGEITVVTDTYLN